MDLLTLTISLSTILCSGVVSATVTHKLSANKAQRDLKLSRLESLYHALDAFGVQCTLTMLNFTMIMNGKKSLQSLADEKSLQQRHISEMEMIVNLYFPALKQPFQKVSLANKHISNEALGPIIVCLGKQQPCDHLKETYDYYLSEYGSAAAELKGCLFAEAESIQNEPLFRFRGLVALKNRCGELIGRFRSFCAKIGAEQNKG